MWIEIYKKRIIYPCLKSQPARAVWIEMILAGVLLKNTAVTACEGCVD